MARRGRSDRDRHGSLADQIGLRLVKRRAELTTQRDVECGRLGDVLKPGSPTICGWLSACPCLAGAQVIQFGHLPEAGNFGKELGLLSVADIAVVDGVLTATSPSPKIGRA